MGSLSPINKGDKFNNWTVIERAFTNDKKRAYWKCQCSCQNQTIRNVRGVDLISGKSKSCSCLFDNSTPLKAFRYNLQHTYNNFEKTALERGFTNSLSIGEYSLLIQQNCVYSNIEPYKYTPIDSCGHYSKTCVVKIHGLDRIDNNKDYELGNVIPCEYYINSGKNNFSFEDFIFWVSNLKNQYAPITVNNLPIISNIKKTYPLKYKKGNFHYQNYLINKISAFKYKVENQKIELSEQQIAVLKLAPCILCGKSPNINILKQDKCDDNLLLKNNLSQIDRWDNSIRDYTINNSTSLCRNCNYFKNDLSIQDLNDRITAIKNTFSVLPKSKNEFLKLFSPKNTIMSLLSKIKEGKIIDYFDEKPKLEQKLLILNT